MAVTITVDAAVLTELIHAARETWEADQEQSGPSVLGHRQFDPLRIARALDTLGSALAAFDAVMLPDTETQ